MSNNDTYDDERNGLWFWIPLILILLVLFFIIRSCSNDDKLWQPSSSETSSTEISDTNNVLTDTLNAAKGKVKNTTNAASDAAKSATNVIKDAADSAATTAGNAASNIGNAGSGLADSTMSAAKSATQKVGDVVKDTGKVATGAASTALSTAGNATKSALNATGDAASKLGNAAVNTTGNVIESGKSAATAAADITTHTVQTAANKVIDIPLGVLDGDFVSQLKQGKLITGKKYSVGKLHFNSSQSEISQKDQTMLNSVAKIANANTSLTIHIHGHTDSSGPESFNQTLSTQRAVEAKNRLIKAGVNGRQIETHGHGSSKPVASNNTTQGRWQNRRTEIEIQQ
jgi:outer membrane protein OmpA-like peptidoglycan-associated protein